MNKKQLEALLIRAAKTFIQGFLGSASFGLILTNSPNSSVAYRALIVGALAAGFSAVMNLWLQPTTK